MTINADQGLIDDTDTNKPKAIDFQVSKNVTVTYNVAANQDGFCAIASHKQGEALYGAGSDSTLVFFNASMLYNPVGTKKLNAAFYII
jgi:hypothetical protein